MARFGQKGLGAVATAPRRAGSLPRTRRRRQPQDRHHEPRGAPRQVAAPRPGRRTRDLGSARRWWMSRPGRDQPAACGRARQSPAAVLPASLLHAFTRWSSWTTPTSPVARPLGGVRAPERPRSVARRPSNWWRWRQCLVRRSKLRSPSPDGPPSARNVASDSAGISGATARDPAPLRNRSRSPDHTNFSGTHLSL